MDIEVVMDLGLPKATASMNLNQLPMDWHTFTELPVPWLIVLAAIFMALTAALIVWIIREIVYRTPRESIIGRFARRFGGR